MKAGILTTYFASNYGAALQPFALKRALENLGCKTEIIRYKQKFVYKSYAPLSKVQMPQKALNILYYFLLYPLRLRRHRKFQKYVLRYINPQKGFCNQIPQNKDFYFIGSDQLWLNFPIGGFDDVYLGNFSTKNGAKKIGYAISMGKESFSEKNCEIFRKSIPNFHRLSMRETLSTEGLKKLTNRQDLTTVIDPSLLIDPKIYEEIEIKNPLPNHKYIFFYSIRITYDFWEKIRLYAEKINAELVVFTEGISPRMIKFALKNKNVHYFPTAGIEEFLGAIKNAECIFTPSFHGTAFSVAFKKRFFSLKLNDGSDGRAAELLNKLGLENRILSAEKSITDDEINYDSVTPKLNDHRSHSLNFIQEAIKE